MGKEPDLRILIVTVVHDPEDARIRHRQLGALQADRFRVSYAAPFGAYHRQVPDGVRGFDLPRSSGRHRLAAVRAARRLIRAEAARQDLVLLHDPELLLAVAGLPRRGPGNRGPVVIWDVHEDTAAALGMKGWLPPASRRLLALLVRAAERWAERRLRLLLAEDGYVERFTRPHPVVPNSGLVPEAEPPPPGTDRAIYLGRINGPRGALDLVELGRLLQGEIAVHLVGNPDPDVRAQVEHAAAQGWVTAHGFVPNSAALALLDGALAGLSLLHDEPNYAHSRPTKALEYMAHGIPVVTTPNAVSVELIQRYGCGVVVPFEDPVAAARALRELRADPPRALAMGAAGRAAALADFNWRLDGQRFSATLREWAGRVRSRDRA